MKRFFGLFLWFSILSMHAQSVLISSGSGQPDPSAQLEIRSGNKGLLIPQLSLTGAQDGLSIPAPAHGLVVFNDGQSWGPAGYCINLGTAQNPQWHQLFANPAVDSLVMAQQRITDLPAPVQPGDAVNKAYVDNLVSGSGGGGGGSQISYPAPTEFSAPSSSGMRFIGALIYCRNLTEGGHTDWRMPTQDDFEHMLQDDAVVLPTSPNNLHYWLNFESTYSSSSNGASQFKYTYFFVNNNLSDSYYAQYSTTSSTPYAICVR